jgi:two-component system response regulator HydG/two-component system response regulator AtoC
VDDNADQRRLLSDLLTPQGFLLDEAEGGVEAIEKLQNTDYDLLLLNIKMPNVTGMDVLKFIGERGLSCRVIVITGVSDISLAIESIKHGADDLLAKPYRVDNLLDSINRVLAKSKPLGTDCGST